MTRIQQVFLDDGGVLNDNRLRRAEWYRLVGEFFAPRLGGTHQDWAEANRMANEGSWERFSVSFDRVGEPGWSYRAAIRGYEIDRLKRMCREARVKAPALDDDCYDLAREASRFVTPKVRSAYPEAVGVVQVISQNFGLFTASGEDSLELEGYLEGMGLRDLFHSFYGADLLDTPKHGPYYYERLFRDVDVNPETSLVVDDSLAALTRAMAQGANVVLVDRGRLQTAVEGIPVVRDLRGVLKLLEVRG